jgi:hypothetical protein
VQWYVKRNFENLIDTVKDLARNYHTADFFKSNLYRRFLKIQEDQGVQVEVD